MILYYWLHEITAQASQIVVSRKWEGGQFFLHTPDMPTTPFFINFISTHVGTPTFKIMLVWVIHQQNSTSDVILPYQAVLSIL